MVEYCEMIEGEDGIYRPSVAMGFSAQTEHASVTADHTPPPRGTGDTWAQWMRSQGCEVMELPRISRTREWSRTFSVTQEGEESRLYMARTG